MSDSAPAVRAIVIDDESLIQNLMKVFLEGAGCEFLGAAADGAQGIELYREHQPDLVLLDINMPEMDGIEALQGIKEINPGAYVVMMTAVDEMDIIEDCMIAGARDYIRKGISADQIAPRIQKHVDRLKK